MCSYFNLFESGRAASAWCWLTKYFVQLYTQSEEEAIFIVIVIINPLIKASFIHVNILPLSPLSLFQISLFGLVSPSPSNSNFN